MEYKTLFTLEPCEYFCYHCGHLRMSFIPKTTNCGHCGSTKILIGKVGELDKEKLKKEYANAD